MARNRFRSATLFLSIMTCLALSLAAVPAQKQIQMQRQAQVAAAQAMKIDVHPLAQGQKIGQRVPVEIILRNALNQPARITAATTFEVEIAGPSGKSTLQLVTIKAGESSQKFEFTAFEAGLTSIRVRQLNDELRRGSSDVLIGSVGASAKRRSKAATKAKSSTFWIAPEPRWRAFRYVTVAATRLPLRADLDSPQAEQPRSDATPPGSPKLLLSISGGEGAERLADGKDAVRISAFYMGPDSEPAPSTIRVWLSLTNGDLDPPQP